MTSKVVYSFWHWESWFGCESRHHGLDQPREEVFVDPWLWSIRLLVMSGPHSDPNFYIVYLHLDLRAGFPWTFQTNEINKNNFLYYILKIISCTIDSTWIYQYDPVNKEQSKRRLPRYSAGAIKFKAVRSALAVRAIVFVISKRNSARLSGID